jgi:ElaA protein
MEQYTWRGCNTPWLLMNGRSRHDVRMNATATPSITWRICPFDQLTLRELSNILMARQLVFSLEQNCVYLDADGHDETAWHIAAWSAGHRVPQAYARLLAPGVKYDEPSIGRVLTTSASRGTGLGLDLVQRSIALSHDVFPGHAIRISAQSRLEAFYEKAGFIVQGDQYMEDGIAHTEMLLPPSR